MTPPDAASREALQFWGYLFKEDNRGSDLLNRLLDGIANYVTAHFPPTPDCADITPAQLAAFYKAVGGDYDILFLKTQAPDLAFIYKNLGCLHSLQPAPESKGFDSPAIPALKPKGFVTWQTIQLLLGPDEHVPFLQNAVERFDIVDPGTKGVFPKLLPKEAFPDKPDEKMERWYQEVSERLRKEMEEGQEEQHQHEHAADQGRSNSPGPGPGLRPPPAGRKRHPRDRISSDLSEESMDDHAGAAEYFRDPLYRRGGTRPRVVRRYSRIPPNSRESVSDRGRQVASTIGRIWPPWGRGKERRGSLTDRHASGGYSEDAAGEYDYSGEEVEHLSPGIHRRHAHGGSGGSSGHSNRAQTGSRRAQAGLEPGSSRSFDSESETDSGSPPRMKVPRPKNYPERGGPERDGRPPEPRFSHRGGYANHVPLHHRRSHSPSPSPREYFPSFNDYTYGRRHSQQQGYAGPAATDQPRPSYAAHVAPSPPLPRERHSDPPSRMAESREKPHERRSPLETSDRERKRERERERAQRERADSHRESTRPNTRDNFSQQQRDKLSVPPQPPTPPPIKTHSGTNLSALNGFGPSKEPLFATQVAHLQPPGGPYVTRTYYDSSTSPSAATAATTTAAPSAANTRSRRPSYPPRGSYSTTTPERAAMPARASSMRYASRSRAPSGSASANASPRMAPMGLDNDRERWAFGSATGGLSSRGSSRERARYLGPDGMQGVGGRRYPVDFSLGPGGAPVGGAGWKDERY